MYIDSLASFFRLSDDHFQVVFLDCHVQLFRTSETELEDCVVDMDEAKPLASFPLLHLLDDEFLDSIEIVFLLEGVDQ